MICTPGGIVERPLCGASGNDFELGARETAVRELREETGVDLRQEVLGFSLAESLTVLPTGPGAYWGEEYHRNYCIVLQNIPAVKGPEKNSVHEVARGGMDGIGTAAGDGVHAWVDVSELFIRSDLVPACRAPLNHLLTHGFPIALASTSSVVMRPPDRSLPLVPGVVAGALCRGDDEPVAKRIRTADAGDVAGSLAALLRGV